MRDDTPLADPLGPFPRPPAPPDVPLPPEEPQADADPTTRFRRHAPPLGGVFTASDFVVEPAARNPLDAPPRAASGVYSAARGSR